MKWQKSIGKRNTFKQSDIGVSKKHWFLNNLSCDAIRKMAQSSAKRMGFEQT